MTFSARSPPFEPLLWLLSVPEETKTNLIPKADSALTLNGTAYPGGPPPGLIKNVLRLVFGFRGFIADTEWHPTLF